MKKWIIIGISAIAVLSLAGFAWVGIAFAQSPTPGSPNTPFGWMGGMMGGYGYGMMGGGNYGPMHDDMVSGLAEAVNLTPEEVQTRLNNGETPWQIAEAQGLTQEQAQQAIEQAHDKALDQAVQDGLLTQEQADWMDQHMESMWNGNFSGFGGCHGGYGPNGANGSNGTNGANNAQPGTRYNHPMMNWGNTSNY